MYDIGESLLFYVKLGHTNYTLCIGMSTMAEDGSSAEERLLLTHRKEKKELQGKPSRIIIVYNLKSICKLMGIV